MPDTLTDQSLALQTVLSDPTTAIVARLSKQPIATDGAPLALEDIVECNFAGYEPIVITDWDVKQDSIAVRGEAVSPNLVFTAAVIVAVQLAYALYLTIKVGDAAAVVWRVFPFVPAFEFDQPGRTMQKIVRIKSFDGEATPPDSEFFALDESEEVPIF